MKKLFLTSYFAFVSKLLLPLLPKQPNQLKLAFIPTAADPYKIKPWFYGDKIKLKLMGFQIINVDIKNKTKEQLFKQMKDIDVIFVSGGNTYYLLEHVQKSGFEEVVKKLTAKGVIYVGSSAGSVLACPTIEHIEDLDDKTKASLTSFKGINLIDFLILPHYGDSKYKYKFQQIMKKWSDKKYKIQTLTNTQVIVVNNNKIEILKI